MKTIKILVVAGVILAGGAAAFIESGVYPIAADVPHHQLTYWLLETLRESSIERASREIEVPPLDDAKMLLTGGADYNEMCAGCHLKAGTTDSDFSIGLYPKPPNLSIAEKDDDEVDAESLVRQHFWVIKRGIKASGMPAWGPTHDDKRIWAMVAFLKRLPELTPEQYQIITARDEEDPRHH